MSGASGFINAPYSKSSRNTSGAWLKPQNTSFQKVRGLTKRGKRPDAPGEDATYEDYKLMLYRAGYAEKDINEAFTRFNVTSMTEHVPEKVAEDIADEVARMTEQKRNYMENHRDYAK